MRSLEQAHEDYAGVIEEAELDAEGYFLLIPSVSLDSIETNLANRVKVLNQADKHSSARLRLEHGVVSFGSRPTSLKNFVPQKRLVFQTWNVSLIRLRLVMRHLRL